MSYPMDYALPASEAPASARAAFIRNTYAHLAGALLLFIGIEASLLMIPQFRDTAVSIIQTEARLSFVLILAFIGASWVADYWATQATSPALQYAGLGLYVVVEALIFLPLLFVAANFCHDKYLIAHAGILTGMVFLGLTATVFVTGRDFSFLGTGLTIASFVAIGFALAGAIFGFSLGLFFSFAMVALASGYIIYDTSNVLHRYRTDQHVAAALALFASVALLFYYILRILMETSRRD